MDLVLALPALTIILIPLAMIVWIPLFIWAAIDVRNHVFSWNAQHGLPTPA